MRILPLFLLFTVATIHADPPPTKAGAFIEADEVTWKVNAYNVARWKTLVGGIEGGQLEADDVQFGLWELAPRAVYHGHKHAAPEIYHVLSGRALWQVGDDEQEVTSGSTIYTKPGQVHRMVNLTDTPVQAIWIWWAPGGNTAVFSAPYEFTEPPPPLPNGIPFDADSKQLFD